jgi:hypothetical protein
VVVVVPDGAVVDGDGRDVVGVGELQDGEAGFSWHCRVETRFFTYSWALVTDDSCTPARSGGR